MKETVLTAPARVLVADPPWAFRDALPGPKRGAVKHYRTLNLQSIKEFSLPPMADDALLIMWRVASMVEEAYEVVRAWGFTPKSELVWVKKTVTGKPFFGMGRIVRGSHETAVVATRGKFKPKSRSIRTVFEAATGKHSKKPDEFYELVERLSDGPYVELFARRPRPGWSCFGDQLPDGFVGPVWR
jgi:N6-adenosine-specific RNA methylase IME4